METITRIFTLYTDQVSSINIEEILIISCDLSCICYLCKKIAFNGIADLVGGTGVNRKTGLVGRTGIEELVWLKRPVLMESLRIRQVVDLKVSFRLETIVESYCFEV